MSGYGKFALAAVDVGEVRDVFLRRGWRGLERNYGGSSGTLLKLIAMAGGDALLAERAAIQGRGRKAGGRAVNPNPQMA